METKLNEFPNLPERLSGLGIPLVAIGFIQENG